VAFSAEALKAQGGRLLSHWVHEVFLHEIAHHVHLSLLSPQAKAEWDGAWAPMQEAPERLRKFLKEHRAVSPLERQRFYSLLLSSEGDLRYVQTKVKGLDRAKFHAWLSQPYIGAPYVTAKNLRWTKERGEWLRVALATQDSSNSQDTLERAKRALGVYEASYFPHLSLSLLQEYAGTDAKVDALINALEVPTDYARSDADEDFAESFVAFLANPERLSDKARFRMQRTLSLSGFYGRPIMRVAQRWLSANSIGAQRFKSRLVLSLDQKLQLDVGLVAQLKSDLRKMTEIYRSLLAEASGRGPDTEAAKQEIRAYLEAKHLFNAFRRNLERLIYRHVLQLPLEVKSKHLENETWEAQEVRKKAWGVLAELSSLFPDSWDYRTDTFVPAPWEMVRKRERNILRYQAEFRELWKALAEYLRRESEVGHTTRDILVDETFNLGRVKVVIRFDDGKEKEWKDKTYDALYKQLQPWVSKFEKVFPGVTQDMTVVVNYGEGRNWDVSGSYSYTEDLINFYPLGDIGTFVHEVGHRYWYRNLPPNAKSYWTEVIKTKQGTITEKDVHGFMSEVYTPLFKDISPEFLSKAILHKRVQALTLDPMTQAAYVLLAYRAPVFSNEPDTVLPWYLRNLVGAQYQIDAISDYGSTNPGEAFAEAFKLYLMKGPGALSEWNRWFFKEITRAGGAKFATYLWKQRKRA
jgi:hypothetical protein